MESLHQFIELTIKQNMRAFVLRKIIPKKFRQMRMWNPGKSAFKSTIYLRLLHNAA